MSDVKAKAEARRAKILARESSSKKSFSALVTEEEAVLQDLADVKPRERPLAARKSFIQSQSKLDAEALEEVSKDATAVEDAEEIGSISREPSSNIVGKAESPKKAGETVSATAPSSSSANDEKPKLLSSKSSSIKFPPAKTMEEIEKEVAENTAKFDKSALKRDDKGTRERSARLTRMATEKITASADPSNIMRLLRVMLIVAIAAFTGYHTAERSRMEAMTTVTRTANFAQEVDEFGQAMPSSRFAAPPMTDSSNSSAEGRTWIGYAQYQLASRMECSVTAVMLVYWLAGTFKQIVYSRANKGNAKKGNIIDTIYGYLNGFEEAVLSVVGELSLHIFALIATVLIHTLYYQHMAQSLSGSTTAAGTNVVVDVQQNEL